MSSTTTSLNDVNIAAVGGLVAAIQQDPTRADTNWQASVTWQGGFRTSAQVRNFTPLISDEPLGLGGTDTAPNPVEQLLAALGNCLAVGYAANATARGIPLESLTIDISGPVDLHTFLGLRAGHAGFGSIDAKVRLVSSAPDAEIASLHEHVLKTSPVGHTLQSAIPVTVELNS